MLRLLLHMIAVLFASLLLLFLVGTILDATMEGYGQSFFSYRLYSLNGLPYWFLSILILLTANGLLFIRLCRFVALWRWERAGSLEVPIQSGILVGANLVLVTSLILFFVSIRTLYL